STSLVDNYINKLFEDPDGRVWVTTYFGICVYNPDQVNFDRNPNRLLEEYGIPGGTILDIVSDDRGNYWFIHEQEGLYRYDTISRKAVRVARRPNDIISSVAVDDRSGNIWVIYRSGTLEEISGRDFSVIYRNRELLRPHTSEFLDFNIRL